MQRRDPDRLESLAEFRAEADDLIARMEAYLIEMEDPAASPDLPRRAAGCLHTLKGNAAFPGLAPVQALAHKLEDVLLALGARHPSVRPPDIDLLLGPFDVLRRLCASPTPGQAPPSDAEGEAQRIVDQILERLAGAAAPLAGDAGLGSLVPPERIQARAIGMGTDGADGDPRIHVRLSRLDALVDLSGELMVLRNRFLSAAAEGAMPRPLLPAIEEFDRIAADLHDAVMRARRIRVDRLVSRMRRIVRETAACLGKRIRFLATGVETEVDRSVVETIADPLLHIARNACDHGIEPPEERRNSGKPEEGTISFAASRDEHEVRIAIQDDGCGLDPAKIARTAIDRGLLREEDAARRSPREILALIFRPGFSTAGTITEVSGRGIGLDIVARALAETGGSVDVESEKGRYARFTIRIPNAFVVSSVLIVRSGEETFAIPTEDIREIVHALPGEAGPSPAGRRIDWRGRIVPVTDLEEVFPGAAGLAPAEAGGRALAAVVILERDEERVGLLVDALLGQEEVIVRPLGPYVPRMREISGARSSRTAMRCSSSTLRPSCHPPLCGGATNGEPARRFDAPPGKAILLRLLRERRMRLMQGSPEMQ